MQASDQMGCIHMLSHTYSTYCMHTLKQSAMGRTTVNSISWKILSYLPLKSYVEHDCPINKLHLGPERETVLQDHSFTLNVFLATWIQWINMVTKHLYKIFAQLSFMWAYFLSNLTHTKGTKSIHFLSFQTLNDFFFS